MVTSNIKSFQPVLKSGWIIKFSILNDCILLMIVSKHTGQVFMTYHENEDKAVKMINATIEKNSKLVHLQ